MQGVRTDIDVEMRAMKYDRYKCKYTAPFPGKLSSVTREKIFKYRYANAILYQFFMLNLF